MTVVHVRSAGWCDLCGGAGRLSVTHVDVDLGLEARQVLSAAASRIARSARARLAELDTAAGGGCEAVAERRFEEGRLRVVEQDLWEAVGLNTPAEDVVAVGALFAASAGWCAPSGPGYVPTAEDVRFVAPAIAEVYLDVFAPEVGDAS